MRDFYEILGISKNATDDEIQAQYRRLAKELHPDLNPGNKNAEEQLKEINAAYHILKNADRRAKYDELSRSTGGFQQGQPEGTRTYSQPQQPRDLNEWADQMFRQTTGMSWEEMMGGRPHPTVTQTTPKKDEEARRREEGVSSETSQYPGIIRRRKIDLNRPDGENKG
jgi:curved DNA-binding protein CbpA